MSFKKGSSVECVDNHNQERHIKLGKKYRVSRGFVAYGDTFVELEGVEGSFYAARFVKYTPIEVGTFPFLTSPGRV